MQFLRTNTAVILPVGPFLGLDGLALATALTITNERISLVARTDAGSAPTNILDNVTGATSGTNNDLNYISGNDAAMMQIELSAANVNRLGHMRLTITDAANHVPVWEDYFVLPQPIYDWLILGTIVNVPANVTQLLGTAWLAPGTAGTPDVNAKLAGGTAWGSGAITAGSIAPDAIGASELAADAVTEIVTAIFARAFEAAYNSRTFDEMIKVMYAAVIAGNVTGAGTASPVVRKPNNAADAVTMTADGSGNRSNVTVTP